MSSTSTPKDYYVGPSSIGKSRRNSPGESQSIPYFQTSGQGPAYNNAFTQPRSSPSRFELSTQALYNTSQWPGHSAQMDQPFSPNYDMTSGGRYSPAPSYGYSTRNSPPPSMLHTQERQRLPPLSTSSSGDRWQHTPGYDINMSGYTNPNHVPSIRSPAASYAPSYAPYPSGSHSGQYYVQGHDSIAINTQASIYDDPMQARSTSPYRHPQMGNYTTPPPISPTSPEEPSVKKKRKRADAHQLKVLNETYARTAFPSTEERHSLAKALDMSARSVQIWFQNKRQSMRQTNRQANNSSSSHQYTERIIEDGTMGHGQVHPSGFPNGQLSLEPPYLTPGQDIPRSHTSASSSRRYRSPEDESQHKQSWARGY